MNKITATHISNKMLITVPIKKKEHAKTDNISANPARQTISKF